MTPQDFTYWLQGFAELNEQPPTAEQWQSIRDHLALVFTKVTPSPQQLFDTLPVSPAVPPLAWPVQTTCIASGDSLTPRTFC